MLHSATSEYLNRPLRSEAEARKATGRLPVLSFRQFIALHQIHVEDAIPPHEMLHALDHLGVIAFDRDGEPLVTAIGRAVLGIGQ